MSQGPLDPGGSLPPYFNISPDEALAELEAPVGTRDFGRIAALCAQGRADLVSRGHQQDGRRSLRLFSTWEITRYLIPVAGAHFRRVLRANPALPQGRTETAGGARWFTLDEVLRLTGAFRRRRQPRQGIPPLPPGRAARQGLRRGQLQGRGRQDLDGGASGDVGGARRLPGAGDRPRQPGLDDLDLRRQRRQRVGHRVPADRAGLRAGAAGREPPPRRARRRAAAARRHARGRAQAQRRGSDPHHALAQHRPDRRPAQPLLGRVPDPGLAHVPARLEALGGAVERARSATACSTPTTSSSSIPRRRSAISPSTA